MNEAAQQDWQGAVDDLQKRAAADAVRRERSKGSGRLNQATLMFIREGAAHGDRHRALFVAAANLSEFGCPQELAHELLTESGLDSGLPPSEVRRQVDCGLAHGSKDAAGADATEASATSFEVATGGSDAADTTCLKADLSLLWQRAERGAI